MYIYTTQTLNPYTMKTGSLKIWRKSVFDNLEKSLEKHNGIIPPAAFFLKENDVASFPQSGYIPISGMLNAMPFGLENIIQIIKDITKKENSTCVIFITTAMMGSDEKDTLDECIVVNLDTPFFSKNEIFKINRDENGKYINIEEVYEPLNDNCSLFKFVENPLSEIFTN